MRPMYFYCAKLQVRYNQRSINTFDKSQSGKAKLVKIC